MANESWGSAIFIRPFRDGTLWFWALIPLVCAGVATCIGVILGSNIHSFATKGLMTLMIYVSPSTANGLTFANKMGGDTLGIGGWVVLVYLAMAIGFGAIGWLTQDRRNIAGAVIPVFAVMVVQLWLMTALTPNAVTSGQASVSTSQQPEMVSGFAAMFDYSMNSLDESLSAMLPLSLHWGVTVWFLLFMVGLTSVIAIGVLTWRGVGVVSSFAGGSGTAVMSIAKSTAPATVAGPNRYCPYCDKKLTPLADGQYKCVREGWPRSKGCDMVIDFREDVKFPCESCGHPLVRGKQAVTRHCHNCGHEQPTGIGGPWEESFPSESLHLGV